MERINPCKHCDGTMVMVSQKNGHEKWVCNKDESHVQLVRIKRTIGGKGPRKK